MIKDIKIYKPIFYRGNLLNRLPIMVLELINSKELIWQLFLRDFKTRYKQSLLGFFWILLIPLMAIVTFLLLGNSGILDISDIPVPYPIYGLLGISLWQIFSGGLMATTSSISSAASFITKINFFKGALVVSSLGQVLIDFIARMTLLIIIYILYGIIPNPSFLLFPFLVIPLVLLTLGLGFITSLLNTIIKDIYNLINIILGFLLFLMPIMYTPGENNFIIQINKYNPVYYLIKTPRDIIILGSSNTINEYLISSLISLIIFLLGWIIFDRAQSKIAEAV